MELGLDEESLLPVNARLHDVRFRTVGRRDLCLERPIEELGVRHHLPGRPDVIVTAGLIAGGSATIHKAMALIEDLLKANRTRAKES